MGNDLFCRDADARVIATTLVADAQLKSDAIRRRLADVARELRAHAATAEAGSEHLLNLANRFERHSQAGETE
jgi:hypothetical protein